MGFLLKEALKTLCCSNQWSYAVFWTIGYQNPKLLIWEECHYEPSKSSLPTQVFAAGNGELPFVEWERLWMSSEACSSQIGNQLGDRVSILISKMMINSQFNIVGEGMVGRAAFTGNHQWILSNSYTKSAHPPEVQNEMHHQFSAGMQTVAVIPVLPHGVVQLGSSVAIMEDIGFVNDVKSLILQLGCVPGALLSDNYVAKNAVEKIGVPVTAGVLVPMDPLGIHKMENSSAYMIDSYNPRNNSPQGSSLAQLADSLSKEVQNNQDTTALPNETAATMNPLPQSHGNPCQAIFSLGMKRNALFGSQTKDGVEGAEMTLSSSNVWPNREASAGSRLNNQCGFSQSGASHGTLMSMEGRIRNQSVENRSVSNIFDTSQLKTSGSLLLGGNMNSSSIPLREGKETSGGINRHSGPVSVPCSHSSTHMAADVNLSGAPLVGIEVRKAEMLKTEVTFCCVADELEIEPMVSKGFDVGQVSKDLKIIRNELIPSEQRIDNELFQALNFPLFHADEHMSRTDHIPDFVLDCQNLDDKPLCSGSTNAKLEDQCTGLSAGDDLFAVLRMDFKNKLHNGHRLDGNAEVMPDNTSTFTSMKEMYSSFYSVNEGISDSGIFSGTGTDDLLDAVVSKAHIAATQSSEDNISCRTTLTKISSSSVPSSSPTYGRVSLPNCVRGQKLQLSDSLDKAGMVKTSSFKSGCSRDDTGNRSQTTSMYGSQISSWVEHGNCVKHDNSVSTAYSKRSDEIGKLNRKRLKPGENPRPRPKDRQMIQDRVKELREIVPNGAKCSIDALLERTIKHMLFLQSVTKHADKLKQTGESKVFNKEGGLLLKDNFEGGATWAFEVGSQSMVCPIIVEDLNPPRQMLVEMLCEERGFFLEIADLIRCMGLTILKGVMEARNDKIWARFAIEANRDVTRMEIFMSLVHLLEQTVKGGASSSNAIENNNLMVHDPCPQPPPIAGTGRSGSLQ